MIRWIVGLSLRLPGLFMAIAVGLLAFGIVQLRHSKVDAMPEFGPPIVEIQTESLGLSASEVEQLITVPLEQDYLDGVPWVAAFHSDSLPGLSSIQMVFEPGTDLLHARQLVQERLSQGSSFFAGLPNVSAPSAMLLPKSSTSRVMLVGLSSKTVSQIDMSILARWVIRPRLLGVPGVAAVSMWGERARQLQVQVDPKRLGRYGISMHEILETTGNALWASPLTFLAANTPGSGGFIDQSNQRLGIQHLQPIRTAAELARIPIAGKNGKPLSLSRVARVVEGHQPLIGDNVLTGGPGLLLVIEKTPGANTVDVTHGVEEALNELKPGLHGININPHVYRPATYIETGMRNVGSGLSVGFALLIVGLFALALSWRTALITVAGVVLSVLAAAAVLYLRGQTINAMVLVGLVMALGVVIDDAVSDVQGVVSGARRPRTGGDGGETAMRTIARVVPEMRSSALYATLVIAVVVVPFFFLRGESGAFFPPMMASFLLAITASMVVAMLVTPALSVLLLSGQPLERRPSPIARWLDRRYERGLRRTLGAPRTTFAAIAAVLVAGAVSLPFLRWSPVPENRDADLVVHLQAAPGTSLPEMDRITRRMADDLRSVAGVQNVAAHVGRAITSDQVVGVDSSELWVGIGPAADHDTTLASIRRLIGVYPGIRAQLLTYPNERIATVLSDRTHPIAVRVFGPDLAVRNQKAQEIRQAISGIEGVVHPRVQSQAQVPTVQIELNLAAAKDYGIAPGDVRRDEAALVSGITVGSLYDQQKVFDVVVLGSPGVRQNLTSIRSLLIDAPRGGQVRLDKVADVRIAPTPTVLHREDIFGSLDVTADVQGRKVGAVLDDVQRRLRQIRFPLEHRARMVGDYPQRQADYRRFIAVAVAAAIAVFLLLQVVFRSWRLAALSVATFPVTLAGGVLAAVIGSRVLSIGSVAGLVVVLAIAVRGAVGLIRHYHDLERDEPIPFGEPLIERGSRDRLVPVTMAAVLTALLFLPFVILGGGAGKEFLHPMAIVILGGLVASTLVNLFVLPLLCARFGSSPSPDIFEVSELETRAPGPQPEGGR
jgi:Cu/Ag efflux pump CusA